MKKKKSFIIRKPFQSLGIAVGIATSSIVVLGYFISTQILHIKLTIEATQNQNEKQFEVMQRQLEATQKEMHHLSKST